MASPFEEYVLLHAVRLPDSKPSEKMCVNLDSGGGAWEVSTTSNEKLPDAPEGASRLIVNGITPPTGITPSEYEKDTERLAGLRLAVAAVTAIVWLPMFFT